MPSSNIQVIIYAVVVHGNLHIDTAFPTLELDHCNLHIDLSHPGQSSTTNDWH